MVFKNGALIADVVRNRLRRLAFLRRRTYWFAVPGAVGRRLMHW
jgi:hypothetical protein